MNGRCRCLARGAQQEHHPEEPVLDTNEILLWVGFNIFILAMLALDLGVFHREAHAVSFREAIAWSIAWTVLAFVFNAGVWYWWGPTVGLQFLTGYLIERSLSIDNIFVFLLIFSYFRTPPQYQHRVLFWGILGALITRAIFIAVGVTLLHWLHWVIYVFGALLVLTGIKMALEKEKEIHPERNPVLRLARRLFRVTPDYRGGHFFVREQNLLLATPLFVVLLLIETSDVIFAVDSIPAIFAITLDPFIIYTSNVFAILGLRAMYFAISGVIPMFRYLHYGLAAVLIFIGAKMLLTEVYEIPITVSLLVVAGLLTASVLVSIIATRKEGGVPPELLPPGAAPSNHSHSSKEL